MYTLQFIADILGSKQQLPEADITTLLTDSRRLVNPDSSLFFALSGPRRNGHLFIPELYKGGVRHFVVSEKIKRQSYPGASFIIVKDVLTALQQLVAYHRSTFAINVIGITGSNGKTIVKEWLYQLLQTDFNIVRSPKSYNSQIGVPLSVWEMASQHELAIFEAGISQPGEMQQLQHIIKPTIGILTHLGVAHSEGFKNDTEKLKEKLRLFQSANVIIANADNKLIKQAVLQLKQPVFFWGKSKDCQLQLVSVKKLSTTSQIELCYKKQFFNIEIPFTDAASVENALSCCATVLYLNTSISALQKRIKQLQPVNMRLEFKKGINNCILINDSYSADLDSLDIALHFLQQQAGRLKKTAILSDFLQDSRSEELLYQHILEQLQKHKITRLIGIGKQMQQIMPALIAEKNAKIDAVFYLNNTEFAQQWQSFNFKDEAILVKGARVFEFEKITDLLEQKAHQTILEINLNAITHNFKTFQQMLKPRTKIMVMVKAFAYGSGGTEVASLLQYHKADYLGVAYADEGVEIRKAGISTPVMVLNPEENAFDTITDHLLEPDLFSFEQLNSFEQHIKSVGLNNYPVHIEVETGMNRLGFNVADIEKLSQKLKNNPFLRVKSVFSHLAASEDKVEDDFTLHQASLLKQAAKQLRGVIDYPFLTHIANSSAIVRFPSLQMDMVRLGIGLYGIADNRTTKNCYLLLL